MCTKCTTRLVHGCYCTYFLRSSKAHLLFFFEMLFLFYFLSCRMKSLEDDALKAQLVLTKVKEVEDEYQNKKDHGKFRLELGGVQGNLKGKLLWRPSCRHIWR